MTVLLSSHVLTWNHAHSYNMFLFRKSSTRKPIVIFPSWQLWQGACGWVFQGLCKVHHVVSHLWPTAQARSPPAMWMTTMTVCSKETTEATYSKTWWFSIMINYVHILQLRDSGCKWLNHAKSSSCVLCHSNDHRGIIYTPRASCF